MESDTALLTPPFQVKGDCICSCKVRRVLEMHSISSDLVRCMCDRVGVI